MTSFAALGVDPRLVDALDRAGITAPFPIQALTIADALAGRDVCGKAKTGSGKTLAFGLPVLARVGRSRTEPPAPSCWCPPVSSPSRCPTCSNRSAWPSGVGSPRSTAAPDGSPDRPAARGHRGRDRHARPSHRPRRHGAVRSAEVREIMVSTKPTAWSTWASCRRSSGCCATSRRAPDAAVLGHARRRHRSRGEPASARPRAPRGRVDARSPSRR